jgi:hypothetical protein
VPNFISGFTDCNVFRAKGITCYGFVSMRFAHADFHLMHDRDKGFSARYSPPFPVLFDASKRVIRTYGVDGLLGFGVRLARCCSSVTGASKTASCLTFLSAVT